MNDIFKRILQAEPFYQDLEKTLLGGYYPISVTGVSGVHKAHTAFCLSQHAPLLLICADEAAATRAVQDINTFAGGAAACLFPEKEYVFAAMEGVSHEYEHKRIEALSLISRGKRRVLCASAAAAAQATVPPDILEKYSFRISMGDEISLEELSARLTAGGYTRCELVEGAAQFSVRGSVVDIFPVSEQAPVRIELWGDEVDSIARFDTESQRRTEPLDEAEIFPALEVIFSSREELCERLDKLAAGVRGKLTDKIRALIYTDHEYAEAGLSLSNLDKYYKLAYEKPAYVFDYFGEGICAVSEYSAVNENMRSFISQLSEDLKLLYESGVMFKKLDGFYLEGAEIAARATALPCVFLDTFMRQNEGVRFKKLINTDCRQTSGWGGGMVALGEELREYIDGGYTVVLLAGSEKTLPIIVSDLRSDGFDAEELIEGGEQEAPLAAGKIYVHTGSLSCGFDYPEACCALITQMKAMTAKRKKPKHKKGEEIRTLSDLKPGDPVVHAMHGIGKFVGIRSLETNGVKKDYITIKYAGTDVLYVPVTQLDLVSRYVGGSDDSNIKLHKLGSAEWQKTRTRVRRAVRDMAEELTKLYAERQQAKGFAFSPDNDWQNDFEERFDYQETDDQLRCISEIKEDMMKPSPMDRLLCGDVGFGKTEVALRAAFKCVLDSKQVAILVPTTVLAQACAERRGLQRPRACYRRRRAALRCGGKRAAERPL